MSGRIKSSYLRHTAMYFFACREKNCHQLLKQFSSCFKNRLRCPAQVVVLNVRQSDGVLEGIPNTSGHGSSVWMAKRLRQKRGKPTSQPLLLHTHAFHPQSTDQVHCDAGRQRNHEESQAQPQGREILNAPLSHRPHFGQAAPNAHPYCLGQAYRKQ